MTFEIRKIGVIGAGQMGSGIAQVSALAGFDVVLNDLAEDGSRAAIAKIDANLARLVERERDDLRGQKCRDGADQGRA